MIRCSLIYPLIEVVDLCPRSANPGMLSYLISFEVFQFGSCFLEKGPSLSNRVRHFFDVSRIQMKIFRFWKFCFAFTNNLKRCLYRIQTNVKGLRLVSLIDVEIIYLLIKVEGISEFIEAGLSVFVFCCAMTYWCNCCVQICFSFDIYV